METPKLPKATFLALAAIGWADGSLQRREGDGLAHAARACGLEGPDLEEIDRAMKEKLALDGVALDGLSPWERTLTYALASWFAALDGIASTDERAVLKQLGDRLGLDNAVRVRAATAANDIACLPESSRPDRYDVAKLAVRLRDRVPQMAK